MKIFTVVGARPEFIQIAPVDREIRKRHTQILVNTGQHYDDEMSKVFFRDLNIHEPELDLGVGSGSHAQQTGLMMMKLEEAVLREQPDFVICVGDTNTTLATGLVAAKLNIPLAHIEAGLRSYDRTMPEEVNRVIVDTISDILFSPTDVAVENLKKEGITQGVHNVGDIRMDTIYNVLDSARQRLPALLQEAHISPDVPFALCTIHRAGNTDERERLERIVQVLGLAGMAVILPVHPRLAKMMGNFGLSFTNNVRPLRPLGFLETIALLEGCTYVITDSGGLQKEAYMLRRPTVTMRDTTEWVETVTSGWNRLCEPDPDQFKAAVAAACAPPPAEHPDFYGTYGVSRRMIDVLEATVDALKAGKQKKG